jgi:hypothetical protein
MNRRKDTLLNNNNLKVLLILNRKRKEKSILVLEDHMHNVKPWKTFTGVLCRMLRRVA